MTLASTQLAWYLTRSCGLVALILLTASVALGVLATARWRTRTWPRFVTQGLHRNVSLLAVSFLGAHIATAVLDSFAPIGWLDAIVPFGSAYRPLWLGLGAIAVDLLIAVVVTSLVRRRLTVRTWRAVHATSWAAWPFALMHGLGTGSDSRVGWTQLVYVGCALVVLAACWSRLAVGWPAHAGPRVLAGVLSVVLPLLVVMWAAAGPLRPGWARRAGTPASLLGGPPTSSTPTTVPGEEGGG